jgi:predicted porin
MKNILKSSVAAGALFALAAPVAGTAQADIKNGNSKVSLTVGGQIGRSLVYVDDGEHSQLFNADSQSSPTRLRFIVSGKLTESIKVGGLIENDYAASNASYSFTAAGESAGDDTAFGIRHAFISFQHKSMGKLSLGQTNSASNGIAESTYNNNGGALVNGGGLISSVQWTTGTGGALSGLTAACQTNHFDGLSRDDVIRYDSPSFAGFSLAASHLNSGNFDAAVRYSGKLMGLSVKGGFHYANLAASSTSVKAQYGGSAAIKHSSGFSVRGNWGKQTDKNSGFAGRSPLGWGVGGSYEAKLSSLGATTFYVDYFKSEDILTEGNKMKTFFVGINQDLDSIGSSIDLVYGRYSLDDTSGTDYNDIDAVLFQTILAF